MVFASTAPSTAPPADSAPIASPSRHCTLPYPCLAPGADDRHGDDREQGRRLRVQVGLAQHQRERRYEQDPAAHAEQAAGGARREPEQDCADLLHYTSSSMATATSRPENISEIVRSEMRCCSDVPASTPATAGRPTSRPLATSTLP